MPIHFHPVLRNRELAMEAAGLVPSTLADSDGYNALKNAETAGQAPKVKLFGYTFYFNNGNQAATEYSG